MDDYDFEKLVGPVFAEFRAKCSELNLINAELTEEAKKSKELHEVYRVAYDKYIEHNNQMNMGLGHQLTEIRSGLQALQATLLDMLVEFLIGPRHPHDLGEKHD